MPAPISPRCHICQREWHKFMPIRVGGTLVRLGKLPGLKLRVTGRIKGSPYKQYAEVECFDCGHVWWSRHNHLIRWAKKVDQQLPLPL